MKQLSLFPNLELRKKTEDEKLTEILTRPKNPRPTAQQRMALNKKSNTKVPPKKEIIVPGPLEQLTNKTEKEVMKDPNLLRRLKYFTETYDGIKLGKEFDKAIAQEDKNLANAKGKTILQRYPKEATPQQVAELKKKFDRYRYEHGEEKPFTKVANNLGKEKKEFKQPKTDLNIQVQRPVIPGPGIKKPEPPKEPFDLAKHIKEKADQRLKIEQEQHDQEYGRGGIPELVRPI